MWTINICLKVGHLYIPSCTLTSISYCYCSISMHIVGRLALLILICLYSHLCVLHLYILSSQVWHVFDRVGSRPASVGSIPFSNHIPRFRETIASVISVTVQNHRWQMCSVHVQSNEVAKIILHQFEHWFFLYWSNMIIYIWTWLYDYSTLIHNFCSPYDSSIFSWLRWVLSWLRLLQFLLWRPSAKRSALTVDGETWILFRICIVV